MQIEAATGAINFVIKYTVVQIIDKRCMNFIYCIDFRCECPYGYDGRDCLTRIDHCKSHPCQNNGTCINGLLDYKCNCHVSFTGSTCEISILNFYNLSYKCIYQ